MHTELYGELRSGTVRWRVLEALARPTAAMSSTAQLAAVTGLDASVVARAVDALADAELAELGNGAAAALGLYYVTDAGRRLLAAGEQLRLLATGELAETVRAAGSAFAEGIRAAAGTA